MSYYETEGILSEYLLFHYGEEQELLPFAFGPAEAALAFPVRLLHKSLDFSRIDGNQTALDLGCAVGRSTFELARFCTKVLGIDRSETFIQAASQLRIKGRFSCKIKTEGDLRENFTAKVPAEIDRSRVAFQTGDATALPPELGPFDILLMSNLIDRLPSPRTLLHRASRLVHPGGQLVISSPYTWLEEFTPRHEWLGGFTRNGKTVATIETLIEILSPDFELIARRDIPFLIREHLRKYQWSISEATTWIRRQNSGRNFLKTLKTSEKTESDGGISPLPGHLYVVATPIGNLNDITHRAVSLLSGCDLIACEDTRTSGILLSHLGLKKQLVPYHDHNESEKALTLADALEEGKSICLISDAGTPAISDPGFRLVRECRRRGLPVVPVPGPSALIAVLSASGLPTNGFLFVGFLPPKSAARRRFLENHRDFPYTLCLYESSHRIVKFLAEIVDVLGPERTISVAKEVTKRHETFLVGTAADVQQRLLAMSQKGEFVVLIAPGSFALGEAGDR